MRVAHVDGQYTAFPLAKGSGVTMSVVRADAWVRSHRTQREVEGRGTSGIGIGTDADGD